MCGIVGFLDARKRLDPGESERLVRAMARAIAHRGPDGDVAFVEPEAGLAFGQPARTGGRALCEPRGFHWRRSAASGTMPNSGNRAVIARAASAGGPPASGYG